MKFFKQMDRGIVFMFIASIASAFMGGFVKVISQTLPSVEVVFFRNVLGLIFVLISFYSIPLVQKGGKPWLLLFRGLMGFMALLSFFYLMAHIPLGEAVTYNATFPLFIALFALLFLKESVHKAVVVAIILGFTGIIFIAQPQGMALDRYMLLGLFSGMATALSYTSVRELRQFYDLRMIMLSFMGVGTVLPLVFMVITPSLSLSNDWDLMFSNFKMPSGIEWGYLLAMGIFATLSQWFITKAYELTKAGIVGVISYSNILFSLIVGITLGDDIPNMLTFLGIGLVIGSGVLVVLSKSRIA